MRRSSSGPGASWMLRPTESLLGGGIGMTLDGSAVRSVDDQYRRRRYR